MMTEANPTRTTPIPGAALPAAAPMHAPDRARALGADARLTATGAWRS